MAMIGMASAMFVWLPGCGVPLDPQDPATVEANQEAVTTATLSLSGTSSSLASSTTSVTATGSGFSASQSVTLTWYGSSTKTLATATTDATGAFSATFTVPSLQDAGTWKVTAADASGVSASVNYTLYNPTLSLSTSSGYAGESIKVYGTHFENAKSLTVMWNWTTTLGTVTSGPNGGFTTTVTIPSTATYGSYPISITDNSTIMSQMFTIPYQLTLSASSGTSSDTISFSGQGYTPGSTNSIVMCGSVSGTCYQEVASVTADGSGNISGSFLPGLEISGGEYNVQVWNASNIPLASTPFDLTASGNTSHSKDCGSTVWNTEDAYKIYLSYALPNTTVSLKLSFSSVYDPAPNNILYTGFSEGSGITYDVVDSSTDSNGYLKLTLKWSTHQMPSFCWTVTQTGTNGTSTWSACSSGC
jgi:hypothetical protein